MISFLTYLLLTTGFASAPEPAPWILMVGVRDENLLVWYSHAYSSLDECSEVMFSVAVATNGQIAEAYCAPALKIA